MHFGRICKNSSKPIRDLKLRSNISYNNVHVVRKVELNIIKQYMNIKLSITKTLKLKIKLLLLNKDSCINVVFKIFRNFKDF